MIDSVEELLADAPVADKTILELRARWADPTAPDIRVAISTWAVLAWRSDECPRPSHEMTEGGVRLHVPLVTAISQPDVHDFLARIAGAAHDLAQLASHPRTSDGVLAHVELACEIGRGTLSCARPRPIGWEVVDEWRDITATDVHAIVCAEVGRVGYDPTPRALPRAGRVDPDCRACSGQVFEVPFQVEASLRDFCSMHQTFGVHEMAMAVFAAVCHGVEVDENDERFEIDSYREARLVYAHALGERIRAPHIPAPIHKDLLGGAEEAPQIAAALERLCDWAHDNCAQWFDIWHDLGVAYDDLDQFDPYLGDDFDAQVIASVEIDEFEVEQFVDSIDYWCAELGEPGVSDRARATLVHGAEVERSARHDPRPGLASTSEVAHEHAAESSTQVLEWPHKVGRNERCPCGSGDKFKRCHGA